jgi:tRNA A-37 threonylcarbamoyl transferase component Bud32
LFDSVDNIKREIYISKLAGDNGLSPKVHDYFQFGDNIYMIMDKLDETLENMMYDNKFPMLYKKVQNKINLIHDLGIVHKDLKLDNIMVKGDDVFIIDFGLAFLLKDGDEELFSEDYIDNYPHIEFYKNGMKCNDWA